MVWLQKMMDGSHGTSGNRSKHYVFILDSGAEEHCTGDKSLLSDYRDEVLPGRCLRRISGKKVRVHGTGSIYNEYFQVKGVLYIPDLNYEENISTIILSVGKLCERNLSVHFNRDGTGSVINNSKLTRNLKHEIVGEVRIAHGRFMLDYLRTSPIRVRPGLASLLVWSSTNGRLSQRTACLQRLPDVSERDAAVAARLDAAIEGEEAVLAAVMKERTADGVKGKGDVVKVDQLRVERTKAVVEAPRVTTAAMVQAVAESTSRSTNYLISLAPNRRIKRTIKSWIKGHHLGSGSFGSVYKAISEDGFFFAVKEVSLVDEDRTLKLEHEISLLSSWEHENIVQYFGTDKKDGKLYIFLELVTQGSLEALYKEYCLQDSQVSAYTRQILNGLHYLHQQNVLHRDIKCANILVDVSGVVKLADFGLAKEMSSLSQTKSSKGTAYWMAPEVVKAEPHGLPADIWSLGCTVLEMLTGKLPYPDMEWTQAFFKIGRGIPPEIPNTLSEDARDFIKKCVQVEPNDRPSAAELLEHPFVQQPLQQYGP